jgi:vancomycin resistance protein YoaR
VRRRWIAAGLLTTLVGAAAAVGTVAAVRAGEALPGTEVAGIDVGGLGRADVRSAVSDLADIRTGGELPVLMTDVRAGVDRDLVEVDLEGTVDEALSAGREGPLEVVLGPLLPMGDRDVRLAVAVDDAGLRDRLEELAAEVDRPAAPGGFAVDGLTVSPVAPTEGRTLEVAAAREPLVEALRTGRTEPLSLPVTTTPPSATPAQVEQVTAAARAALATSYVLSAGEVSMRVAPQDVAPLLRAEPVDGALALVVDPPGLEALVAAKAVPLKVAPRPASVNVASTGPVVDGKENLTWSPVPASVAVVPAADGRDIDVPAAVAELSAMVVTARPEGPLPVVPVPAPVSTADATGIDSLIGTFTTYFQAGQPRATNIRRIAEIVNGTLVPPGKRFSLNEAAGERTKARGFVADGAIVDGVLVDEVGGGVSQFATTIFNAAFFAGLPIEQHKPHSFYISRYPAGRESTVYYGQIDVRFRNDTSAGLLVRTRSTPGSVTVELYGSNGGRLVTAEHGPRRPTPDGGFTIDVTRTVSGGDGVSSRRVFSTTYDPVPPEQ